MARGSNGLNQANKAGAFFGATLVMWAVSVFFEILFNRRSELVSVLVGFCFYQSANWTIRNWVSRDPLFVNTSVSLLHSFFTSTSVIFVLVNQWMRNGSSEIFEHSQLFGGTWPWAYQALCFSCGYFAYDQWDMLRYRLYRGWVPSILLHHLLHSVFLHLRKVQRMSGVRDAKSTIVKAEWVLNWATFVLARFTSHVLITVKLIKDAPKFGKGVELPLALFGMATMNVLNLFLGVDLFNAYRRENSNPLKSPNHSE
ncbi:uncharacterized protein LOC127799873 isoform X2 [Diospyros lotus]|uniref:uncharacterized protein LOC127799873 isoform X2 n=1 Tax=Diospyros lotus TaxID=55363 RepID=UPI00225265BC|nr:uncharacterized protein LOC127799873 isoform X2 [Diospyros lotus]